MYSEFEIALAMAIVWGVDAELIHTRPFMPTVHSKGKYFPRHFKRTNSLLRSLQKRNKRVTDKHGNIVHFFSGSSSLVRAWARGCSVVFLGKRLYFALTVPLSGGYCYPLDKSL